MRKAVILFFIFNGNTVAVKYGRSINLNFVGKNITKNGRRIKKFYAFFCKNITNNYSADYCCLCIYIAPDSCVFTNNDVSVGGKVAVNITINSYKSIDFKISLYCCSVSY